MPYIKPADRSNVAIRGPLTAGELNYAITMLLTQYLKRHGRSYATCNEIVGAIECAKTEFYRRIIAPLEEIKILEHGDVY